MPHSRPKLLSASRFFQSRHFDNLHSKVFNSFSLFESSGIGIDHRRPVQENSAFIQNIWNPSWQYEYGKEDLCLHLKQTFSCFDTGAFQPLPDRCRSQVRGGTGAWSRWSRWSRRHLRSPWIGSDATFQCINVCMHPLSNDIFPRTYILAKKDLWQPKQTLACRILPLHSTNLQNRCHLHWTELLLAHDGAHRLWSAPTWLLLLVCIHPDLGNSCREQQCRIFVPGKRVVPSQYF